MKDSSKNTSNNMDLRYMGRIGQLFIYFRKLTRMFIYQSDWIAIPMAALIAGLVAIALGKDFGVTKEGTLMGVFALVCVCLWNGTFNSIQIICRERDVIKREHRSGTHISSYILAHMLYQSLICIFQCTVTLITANVVGMHITGKGLFTPFLVTDIGITMFLTTYAADMLALFISSVVRSTTIAMTTMPFILIFQMVFSGGLFPIPDNLRIIDNVTISSPSFKAMASQMNTNSLPYGTVDRMFKAIDNYEIEVTFDGSDVLNMLSDENNENAKQVRDISIGGSMTAEDACRIILYNDSFSELRSKPLIKRITVGSALDELATNDQAAIADIRNVTVEGKTTARGLIEFLLADPGFANLRSQQVVLGIDVGELLTIIIELADIFPEINNELNKEFGAAVSVGDVINIIRDNDNFGFLYDITLINDTSVGEALKILMNTSSLRRSLDTELSYYTTVGDVIDYLNNNAAGDQFKDTTIVYHAKVSDIINKVGQDELKNLVESEALPEQMAGDFENTKDKVLPNWLHLLILIAAGAIAAIIALEFVDKDKR